MELALLQGMYCPLVCCIEEIVAVRTTSAQQYLDEQWLVSNVSPQNPGFIKKKQYALRNRELIKIPNVFGLALSLTTQTRKSSCIKL